MGAPLREVRTLRCGLYAWFCGGTSGQLQYQQRVRESHLTQEHRGSSDQPAAGSGIGSPTASIASSSVTPRSVQTPTCSSISGHSTINPSGSISKWSRCSWLASVRQSLVLSLLRSHPAAYCVFVRVRARGLPVLVAVDARVTPLAACAPDAVLAACEPEGFLAA